MARQRMQDKAKEILILFMTGFPRLAWDVNEAIDENNLDNDSELSEFFNIMDARFK